jgi:uncharacterized protein YecT (DUF1311 family)
MKSKTAALLILILCLLLASPETSGQKSKKTPDCVSRAKTQRSLNDCAGKDGVDAERDLNATYQSILKKYADSPAFVERLRAAQRAWLKFRDAQVEMRYPPSDQGGSVAAMCRASYKAELTQERTKQLKASLDGIEEGDVCAGSIKFTEQLK